MVNLNPNIEEIVLKGVVVVVVVVLVVEDLEVSLWTSSLESSNQK